MEVRLSALAPAHAPPAPAAHQVRSLRVTVLSTMLTDFEGVGEWGFAAVVEVDGRRLLFDTGARPRTVLDNAHELGIDLSDITDVVLSGTTTGSSGPGTMAVTGARATTSCSRRRRGATSSRARWTATWCGSTMISAPTIRGTIWISPGRGEAVLWVAIKG